MRRIYFATVITFFLTPVLASAQATPTLAIQSLSPGNSVTAGNEVTFTAVPANFASAVGYTASDSFSGSITSSNINSSGTFTWIPSGNDVGTHTITITGTDGLGGTASASVTITVAGPPTVTLSTPTPSASVTVGQTIFFNAYANGFTSPSFFVSDANTSSVGISSINAATGAFHWSPLSSDVGSHSLTVTATDTGGHSASATVSLTVGAAPSISLSAPSPNGTVSSGQTVTFTTSSSGFTSPTFSVSDSLNGSSVSNSNVNNSTGAFSWTPLSNDLGVHVITIHAADSLSHTATASTNITVGSIAGLTLGSSSAGNVLPVGTNTLFTAYPTGFTNPTFSVSDTFTGSSASQVAIGSSGVFAWTPVAKDVGAHTITITASDSIGHTATSSVQITVTAGTTLSTTPVPTIAVAPTPAATSTSTTSAPAHVFSANLHLGMTSDDVAALQSMLSKLGFFSGAATGYYGPLTASAVAKFQTSHGLEGVGAVGPGTRALLNGTSAPATPAPSAQTTSPTPPAASNGYKFTSALSLGSTGAAVSNLQTRLAAEGLYSGPISGYFGALTMKAVMQYQAAHGIAQLGNVGPSTRAALNQ